MTDIELDNAINIITRYYNIEKNTLTEFLKKNNNVKNSNDGNKNDIIMPFYGVIFDDRCKGIIYNHGLYTQCNEKTKGKCKKCENNKYGDIYDRNNYEIGKFKTNNDKNEISYTKFIKKMKYDIEIVKQKFSSLGLDFTNFVDISNTKNRGRPRKEEQYNNDNNSNDNETIEVVMITINEKSYYKTSENIVLDIETCDIVGILKNGNIESV